MKKILIYLIIASFLTQSVFCKLIEKDEWVKLVNLCAGPVDDEKKVVEILESMGKKLSPKDMKKFLNQSDDDCEIAEWWEEDKKPVVKVSFNGVAQKVWTTKKTSPIEYNRQTVLITALKKNHEKIAKTLVLARADLNKSYIYESELTVVAKNGNKGLIGWLLQHGLDLNTEYPKGLPSQEGMKGTALSNAAQIENKELVDFFLGIKGFDINQKTIWLSTPLMDVAKVGKEDFALWLIKEKRADISLDNQKDKSSVLEIAVSKGLINLVNYLLNESKEQEKVAKLAELIYSGGLMILHKAVMYTPIDKLQEIMQLLLEYYKNKRYLGNEEAFKKIINTETKNSNNLIDLIRLRIQQKNITDKAELDTLREVEKMLKDAGVLEKYPLQKSLEYLKIQLVELVRSLKKLLPTGV